MASPLRNQPRHGAVAASAIAAMILLLGGCTSNRAPVFEPIPDQSVTVGEVLRLTISATDRDGDPVSYAARGLPQGGRLDTTLTPPVFTWSPVASEAEAGGRPHPITFTAEDDQGALTEARVVITVFPGNARPTFTSPTAFVLDPRVQPEWAVLITVRDDDDVSLEFELAEAPEGMKMEPLAKAARLTWRPSPSQLVRQRVFGVTVNAWDDDLPTPVSHRMTLLVLNEESAP